jgi:hypothetical protein
LALAVKSELGQEIFEHVIHRMLKGDSMRELALYCHRVSSNYLPEPYRKWLRVLQHNSLSERREQDASQMAINAFNTAKAALRSATREEIIPDGPSDTSLRWLKRNVTKEWKSVDTETEAQEFAKLDDVDRNLIHQLRKRFVKMVAEEIEDGTTPEGGEFDEAAATGETNK